MQQANEGILFILEVSALKELHVFRAALACSASDVMRTGRLRFDIEFNSQDRAVLDDELGGLKVILIAPSLT